MDSRKGRAKSSRLRNAIQPGGTYVMENPAGDDQAFMGASADFTQEGLGYERRPNAVTCASHFESTAEAAGLKAMFESVWNNPAMVEEVTEQVAARVETLYRENPPESIYFLTLYHLSRHRRTDKDLTLNESAKLRMRKNSSSGSLTASLARYGQPTPACKKEVEI